MFDRRSSKDDLATRNRSAELHRAISDTGACHNILLRLLRRIDERLARVEADISDLKRNSPHGPQPAHEVGQFNGARGQGDRIAELQLENSQLRGLVTDLLLEKIRLEEVAKDQKSSA